MKIRPYSFLLLLLVVSPALSQETETTLFKNERRNERYNAGTPILSAVILPAYTPEMGFILTGGCLVSFKTKKNNDYLRHSIFSFFVNTNLKDGFETYFGLNSYWLDDRLLFNLDANLKNRTDHYWGIGFNNAENIEQGDNTTRFKNNCQKLTPSILIKIVNHFYVGMKADFNVSQASELSDLMLEDINILKDSNEIRTSGLGLIFSYDSRDIQTNTTKGFLINLDGIIYDKFLSGKYRYQQVGIDYRHFIPVIREGSILAWQLNGRLGFADIPWCELQKLGSSNELRGFFYGQYRDKSSAVLQLEYRHTFAENNHNRLSRHGFVFWIGSGTVFPEISKINKLLFNTGLGYRFEIQPHNNLRIDFGFGTESFGIYVNFNESF
jgi:hypothetical protein